MLGRGVGVGNFLKTFANISFFCGEGGYYVIRDLFYRRSPTNG